MGKIYCKGLILYVIFILEANTMSWDSSERRKFVRVSFPCKIIISGPKEETISAIVDNISAGGIRIILERKIPPGTIIKLDIHGIMEEPLPCEGKVLWVFSKEDPENGRTVYDTGVEFSDLDHKCVDEIKKLVLDIVSGKRKPAE
jgi:c-di-GMP-binding flagellar brake protein YcgR